MHYVTTSFTRKKNNFVFEVNFFAARSTSTQQQQQNKNEWAINMKIIIWLGSNDLNSLMRARSVCKKANKNWSEKYFPIVIVIWRDQQHLQQGKLNPSTTHTINHNNNNSWHHEITKKTFTHIWFNFFLFWTKTTPKRQSPSCPTTS